METEEDKRLNSSNKIRKFTSSCLELEDEIKGLNLPSWRNDFIEFYFGGTSSHKAQHPAAAAQVGGIFAQLPADVSTEELKTMPWHEGPPRDGFVVIPTGITHRSSPRLPIEAQDAGKGVVAKDEGCQMPLCDVASTSTEIASVESYPSFESGRSLKTRYQRNAAIMSLLKINAEAEAKKKAEAEEKEKNVSKEVYIPPHRRKQELKPVEPSKVVSYPPENILSQNDEVGEYKQQLCEFFTNEDAPARIAKMAEKITERRPRRSSLDGDLLCQKLKDLCENPDVEKQVKPRIKSNLDGVDMTQLTKSKKNQVPNQSAYYPPVVLSYGTANETDDTKYRFVASDFPSLS